MPSESEPFVDSVWLRPARARRGRPQLSREEIVRAAVALLDAEGLDGLSMRRLAAAIGAGATSLYFYVAHKDELLELAVDEVMGEVEFPAAAEAGWRAAAAGFARGFRAMILRHPWVIPQFGVQPALGPNALRMGDRSIEVLAAAGLDRAPLAWASSLLMGHAIGAATTESAMRRMLAVSGRDANELRDQARPYLDQVGAGLPHFAGWWRENHDLDMEKYQDEAFEFGLERLLDGLEGWLARSR